MNLFENILNKAKTGVNYLSTGKAGSDLYDWANPEQKDPIQRFLDDPQMGMDKKQALFDNLKSGVPKEVLQSYLTEKYYNEPQMKEVLPMAKPLVQSTGKEIPQVALGKMALNAPTSLWNMGAGLVNIGATALEEGVGPTASMIGKGIVKSAGEGAMSVQGEYSKAGGGVKGTLAGSNKVIESGRKFVTEDPSILFAPQMIKGAGQIASQGGKAIVKSAEVIAPKLKTVIKKPVTIVKNKTIDIFGKEIRPVQDIAGNILQPYKGMVENLDDATSGLRRVVDETGTSTDTFQGLLGKIEQTQTKYAKMKQDSLGQITQTKKSVSAQKALENLDNVYSNVSSKDMVATQLRVKELARKNMNEGLTPLEMDEVKILHTKANNLFNEKGQTTGGFSSDDLRGIRKDLKEEIELFAEENGVSNIREINKIYGELSDARTLAQNQVDNLRSYMGRQIPATRLQKIADFIMEFPIIKQAFADPARILASSLFKTLRGDKINPIEVQKRLPGFLKELKDAGMKSGDLQKVEKMIKSEVKLLPTKTQSTTQPRAIPLGKSQAEIIADSKKELSNVTTPRPLATTNTPMNVSKNTGKVGGEASTQVTLKVVKPSSKPIVKNLQKTEKSATIGDMETKKLKKSKALRVYDVIKLKNNDITSVPFDDFYSLARASTKGMTKDKAWGLWMNKMLQKVEKGESVDIDILKKYPLAGVIIKDFLKTKINPFE